jgi:hypothetical protein
MEAKIVNYYGAVIQRAYIKLNRLILKNWRRFAKVILSKQ